MPRVSAVGRVWQGGRSLLKEIEEGNAKRLQETGGSREHLCTTVAGQRRQAGESKKKKK